MRPTQHPSNNLVLGAPEGWNQDEIPCSALPVTQAQIDGRPIVMTYWRPTVEELAQLNAGSLVELAKMGTTMPPTAISVLA